MSLFPYCVTATNSDSLDLFASTLRSFVNSTFSSSSAVSLSSSSLRCLTSRLILFSALLPYSFLSSDPSSSSAGSDNSAAVSSTSSSSSSTSVLGVSFSGACGSSEDVSIWSSSSIKTSSSSSWLIGSFGSSIIFTSVSCELRYALCQYNTTNCGIFASVYLCFIFAGLGTTATTSSSLMIE